MNVRPIEEARDADLRHSFAALLRAARRAREIAEETGTELVVSRNGVIEHLHPTAPPQAGTHLQEPPTHYDDK